MIASVLRSNKSPLNIPRRTLIAFSRIVSMVHSGQETDGSYQVGEQIEDDREERALLRRPTQEWKDRGAQSRGKCRTNEGLWFFCLSAVLG